MTEQEALAQATEALTATDAATTASADFIGAINTGVDTLLAKVIASNSLEQAQAVATQAQALNAKAQAILPVLQGIAAKVTDPVPVPVPPVPDVPPEARRR